MEKILKHIEELSNLSTLDKGSIDIKKIESKLIKLDFLIAKVSDLDKIEYLKLKKSLIQIKRKLEQLKVSYNTHKGYLLNETKGLVLDLLGDLGEYNNGEINIEFSGNDFKELSKIIDDNIEGYFEKNFLRVIKFNLDKTYIVELLKKASFDVVSYYENDGDFILKMRKDPLLKDVYNKYFNENILLKSALLPHNRHEILDKIDFYKKYLSLDNLKKLLLNVDDYNFFSNFNIKLYVDIFGEKFIRSKSFENIVLNSIEKHEYNIYNLLDVIKFYNICGFDESFLLKVAEKNPNIFFSKYIFKLNKIELIEKLFFIATKNNLVGALKFKNNIIKRKYIIPRIFNNKKHKEKELLNLCNKIIPIVIADNNLGGIEVLKKEEFLLKYSQEIANNSVINRGGRFVNLGKYYGRLKDFFYNKKDFLSFVEKQLVSNSTNISRSINDIYDYYEELSFYYEELNGLGVINLRISRHKKYIESLLGGKPPINIKSKISTLLKKYSLEELISSLGNHTINYSITFNLILKEIFQRLNDKSNIINFINKNNNLNEKTKKFLIGQLIIGLSARGKIEELNNLLLFVSDEKLLGNIIFSIIDYNNNDLFNRESFLGFLIGLPNLIENNEFIKNKIKFIFHSHVNEKFNLGLYVVLKSKNDRFLKKLSIEPRYKNKLEKEYFSLIKYSLFPKKVHDKFIEGKSNDILMIYGGSGSGGGLERYDLEVNKFIGFGYKILKKTDKFIILEKNKVKIVFVNYDSLDNKDLKFIFKKEGIEPELVVYRGHNFYTSRMILKTNGYSRDNVIIDGGCRNISKLSLYRKRGLKNQILAYDSTGKGDHTLGVVTNYIKHIRDVRKNPKIKDSINTWNDFKKKYNLTNYAKKHIKFPGSMIDILSRVIDK